MENLLKRWQAILVSIGAICAMLWGGYSFASERFNIAVDTRVKSEVVKILTEMKFAEMVKKEDFSDLKRRFNGVQETVNGSAGDRREMKQQFKGFLDSQKIRDKALDDKFDLLIQLYQQQPQ